MTSMLHPPYLPNLTWVTFLVSHDEKSPQREMFGNVEEVKEKTAEALKGIKTVLSSGKNNSIDVLHQMESISKVTEV